MLRKNHKALNKTVQATGFKPHKGQQKILDAFIDYRFICFVGGRRYGKSKIASIITDYGLLERDCKILCVSKTYKLAKKVWNYVTIDAKKLLGKDLKINSADMIAKTAWGSSLELGSADNPDSLLGDGYDIVIVDEAATLSEKIFQQNILPMIRDRKGTVVLITTPRGYNWLYTVYQKGQLHEEGWWSYRGSSFENTKVYTAEEIELVRKQSERMYFEQEYLAMFRSFADAVYSDFKRETHVITKLPDDFDSWDKYVSIDPGYAQMAAMVWFGYNKVSDELIIYKEHLGKKMQHKDVLRKLIEHEPKGKYQGIVADVAGKQRTGETGRSFKSYLMEQPWFQDNGYYISSKRYIISEGINKVRGRLLNIDNKISLKVLESCSDSIKMFENYHYKENAKDENPDKDGVFDHAADAIRYLVEYIARIIKVYEHKSL